MNFNVWFRLDVIDTIKNWSIYLDLMDDIIIINLLVSFIPSLIVVVPKLPTFFHPSKLSIEFLKLIKITWSFVSISIRLRFSFTIEISQLDLKKDSSIIRAQIPFKYDDDHKSSGVIQVRHLEFGLKWAPVPRNTFNGPLCIKGLGLLWRVPIRIKLPPFHFAFGSGNWYLSH